MVGGTAMVTIWEQGHALSSLERCVLVLRTWDPTGSESDLSIDEMNRRLLQLRSTLFGPKMEFYAECQNCGEAVEFSVDASVLAAEEKDDTVLPSSVAGRELVCRPPSAGDVLAAAAAPDPRRELAWRCLQGNPDEHPELDEDTLDRVEEWLMARYPLLEIHFGLTCPNCGHGWDQLLDIDAVLWRDIDHEARRLLADVDQLARRYGWSESEILELSPQRRLQYLEFPG